MDIEKVEEEFELFYVGLKLKDYNCVYKFVCDKEFNRYKIRFSDCQRNDFPKIRSIILYCIKNFEDQEYSLKLIINCYAGLIEFGTELKEKFDVSFKIETYSYVGDDISIYIKQFKQFVDVLRRDTENGE